MSRTRKLLGNERGLALGASVVALVVVGALVAAALFVGTHEHRAGLNTVKMEQAFAAAQEGAQLQVADWGVAHPYNKLAVGDSATFNGTLADGTGWYRGTVRKLSDLIYLVRSEGFSGDDETRQHLALIVRLRVFELDIAAGLETQGDTQVGGNAQIDGTDEVPPGWGSCPAAGDNVAGVRIGDDADLDQQHLAEINGDPPVDEDPTINDSTLTTFGDAEWSELTSLSTLSVSPTSGGTAYQPQPTASGGVCTTSDELNWGEPETTVMECKDYAPFIHVAGDLKLTGGRGQGILMVDGNLEIQGNFKFYGPVIVRGTITMGGTAVGAPKIYGGVIAANVYGGQNQITGDAEIQFSSCSLFKALQQNAPGFLVQERSWVQLY